MNGLQYTREVPLGYEHANFHALNNICGRQEYILHWTDPHGRCVGIMLGINLEDFDIGNINEGDIYVKFRNKYWSFENWCFLL